VARQPFCRTFYDTSGGAESRGFGFCGCSGASEHLLCVILSWSFEINMRAHVWDYTNGR